MYMYSYVYMHTIIQAYSAYTAHTELLDLEVGVLRSTSLGCEIDVSFPILLHRILRTTGNLHRSPTGSQLLHQPRFTVSKDGSLVSTKDNTMDSRFTTSPGQGFLVLHFIRTSFTIGFDRAQLLHFNSTQYQPSSHLRILRLRSFT